MTQCLQSPVFFKRRKQRRERVLRKMVNMRAAKERKRMERIAAGWTPEPKMERAYLLEFGVRNKATGEMAWVDLKSVRHAAKALGLVLQYYCP